MIPLLICFSLSFFETLVYVSALEVIVETKEWYKKYKWLLVIIATANFVLCAYVLDEVFYIKIATTVLCYIAIAKLIVKAKSTVACTLAMIFHNYLVMLEYSLMLLVVKITIFRHINPALEYDYYEVQMIIAEILINIIITLICYKNRGRLIEQMNLLRDKEWLSIFLITFFSSLILTISVRESGMQENYYVDIMVICVDVTIAFLDFAIIGLFIQSIKKQKHIVENEEIIEKQKRRTHEFGNRMTAIKGMLDSGRIEELQDYVNVIAEKELTASSNIDTGHVMINTIINAKYEEARQKNISFIMKISDLSGITISDDDIVILLSNLLNNAIEASDKSKERIIKLKFAVEDNTIILSVKNSIETVPIEADGELVTSKSYNREEHGVGLKNVKAIIGKYNGRYIIDYDDRYFIFSSVIPL